MSASSKPTPTPSPSPSPSPTPSITPEKTEEASPESSSGEEDNDTWKIPDIVLYPILVALVLVILYVILRRTLLRRTRTNEPPGHASGANADTYMTSVPPGTNSLYPNDTPIVNTPYPQQPWPVSPTRPGGAMEEAQTRF